MDINNIPEAPGCYIFRDSAGSCLYVGKSKKLRSRVRSYFNKSDSPKVKKLAMLIAGIEYRLATCEIDALYLEHSLIKTYRPVFNSQMKKDLRPHYICIDWTKEWPGIFVSDKPVQAATRYGSFTSAYEARDVLTTISRAWKLPSCEATNFDRPHGIRSCLNMHIGRCIGPCQHISGYREVVSQAAAFMQGRSKQALLAIKQEMSEAVAELDFEKAAWLRDSLNMLTSLQRLLSYRVPFMGKRICVLIKGYHEPEFMLLYFKNGQLRHAARLKNQEEWQEKREGFILGMTGKTETSHDNYMYTSAATIEIRARKLYIDVTKTSKANLAPRLDKAIKRFTEK